MKTMFKNETLKTIVILIVLTMQFVLTMTGHQQLDTELVKIASYAPQQCATMQVGSP